MYALVRPPTTLDNGPATLKHNKRNYIATLCTCLQTSTHHGIIKTSARTDDMSLRQQTADCSRTFEEHFPLSADDSSSTIDSVVHICQPFNQTKPTH